VPRYLIAVAAVAIVSVSSLTASALDVTSCEQLVPKGQTGELQNDLNCAGEASGVGLDDRATLRLNGHRVTGPTTLPLINALGSATIVGPGELSGSPETACVQAVGNLVVDGGVDGLDVHGCSDGIDGLKTARLSNVTVHDNAQIGIYAPRLVATNVSSTGNNFGLIANASLKATSVTLAGNRSGGINSTRNVKLVDSTIDGSGVYGIIASQVTMTDSSVSNSGGVGVIAKAVTLKHSSVTGTGSLPQYLPANTDLHTQKKPKLLRDSTCGKSWATPPPNDAGTGSSWGVCAND
jgi:hypothetical protein